MPPPRWVEYNFGKCGNVLKLSALKPANSLCRKQFLHAPYLKSCSPPSLHLTAWILWVSELKFECQKKKMTSPVSAQRLSEQLPPYPAFKSMFMANSVLNWDQHWEDQTGLLRIPANSLHHHREHGFRPVPQLLKHIPDFMKSQAKLWENCLQQLIGASQGSRKLKTLWKNS